MTIENLKLAKIIVWSPQPSDMGNLAKENKLNNREVKEVETEFGNQAEKFTNWNWAMSSGGCWAARGG